MATINNNAFTQYNLTEQEQLAGTTLNFEQKLCIQNQMASIAMQKLALAATPNDYNTFIQNEAYLGGQLAAFQYLLDSSAASEAVIYQQSQQFQE
jgi:hypothetical protein